MAPKVSLEHKKAVKKRILHAAEDLFSSKGYHETSMDNIVEKSGMSKGAIYGHFKSKENLFLEILEKQQTSTLSQIKSSFSPKDSPMKKLEKAVEMAFSSQVEHSRETCRMNLEFFVAVPKIEALKPRLENRYATVHKFIAEIIEEGVKKGEFRQDIDVDSLVSIIIATLDGLSLHWATLGPDFDWQQIKNIFVTVLLNGIHAESRNRS